MNNAFHLNRFPETNHPSLKAWNAADELMVETLIEGEKSIGIYNDGFGYLTCTLANERPLIVTDLHSQATAIKENANINNIELDNNQFFSLTADLPKKIDVAFLKIPKSLPLFETYLQTISANLSDDDGQVICGFMTKYFTPNLLQLAAQYFEKVEQSKAKKKARLLLLSGKKKVLQSNSYEQFQYQHLNIKQHKGVFSAGKIDKATDYLLQNLLIPEKHNCVLDLACGNGIIGKWILDKTTVEELHFLDDSQLAIASAKENCKEKNSHFHHTFNLDQFDNQSFDWIITNPPFHFENTIDISIPTNLFKQAADKLKPDGVLTIIANSNLGYESYLKQWFKSVEIQASNHQFKIYNCFI